MPTVWKYDLPILALATGLTIEMPEGARVLHVDEQFPAASLAHRDCLQLWALVDTALPTEPRRFQMWGTGYDGISPDDRHVGTVLWRSADLNAALIWHIFEITPAKENR